MLIELLETQEQEFRAKIKSQSKRIYTMFNFAPCKSNTQYCIALWVAESQVVWGTFVACRILNILTRVKENKQEGETTSKTIKTCENKKKLAL